MATITIFSIPQVITLTLSGDVGTNTMNYPVNRSDFKLFRDVQNEVQFFVKDIDRKPIDLTGLSLIFTMIDVNTKSIILQQPLTILDVSRGLAQLTIPVYTISPFDIQTYSYTVSVVRADGTTVLLYTDRDYGPHGSVSIVAGINPEPRQPITINSSDMLYRNNYLYSGSVYDHLGTASQTGLVSAAIYSTNFTGIVNFQATLSNAPNPDDSQWFAINGAIISLTEFTGITPINFQIQATAIRSQVAALITPLPNGSVDKIIYQL